MWPRHTSRPAFSIKEDDRTCLQSMAQFRLFEGGSSRALLLRRYT